MRKLPVYLVLDVSGSMMGEPINSVNNGVQMMTSALKKDPYALETAYISVITFASDVVQTVPLTEINSFQPPQLSASGGTSLGGALAKVAECADREVQKSTPDQKGDWKPLVFIMTDGIPTDDPKPGIEEFRKRKWGVVVACAVPGADERLLTQITENVVKLETSDQNSFAAFFKWVSASISTSSRRVDAGSDADASTLPPPPEEITLVQP